MPVVAVRPDAALAVRRRRFSACRTIMTIDERGSGIARD
jgi:hypothetical protein